MEPHNKKELSDALVRAMDREGLSNRDTAKRLDVDPKLLSLVKNEKYYSACPKRVWERIEDWINSREPLSNYQFVSDTEFLENNDDPEPSGTVITKSETIATVVSPAADPQQLPASFTITPAPEIPPQRLRIALDIEVNLSINIKK